MPSITVRDVPQEVRDELAARAARSGQSLQEYLKGVLVDFAYRPMPADVIYEMRRHAVTREPMDYDALFEALAADRK